QADVGVAGELWKLERRLKDQGLLPDGAATTRRILVFVATEALLLGVAGMKIHVAFQRGRTNVQFLFLLGFAAAAAAWPIVFPPATARGAAALAQLRTLL